MTAQIGPVKSEEFSKLPPMSASLNRLIRLLNEPNADARDIARIVELDQALTSNVLRWANSGWSQAARPISTVREAVIRLGMGNIINMSIGRRLAGDLRKPYPGYELEEKELWRHSVAAALAAEALGEVLPGKVPAASFSAALLHDIGKMLLGEHISQTLMYQIRELMEKEKITHVEAELKIMGTDHTKVGAAIGRYWNFPENIVRAIEFHHDPEAHFDEVLDVVHISNAVSKFIGIGMGSEAMHLHGSMEAARRLGLDTLRLENVCATVQARLAGTEALWEE